MLKKTERERPDIRRLEDMPNVGRAIAADLRRIGIDAPAHLEGRDPYVMYEQLCEVTGARQDPCVLDTFIAAVRFADGGPPLPWWAFTAERKQVLGERRPAVAPQSPLVRPLGG